MLLKTLKTQPHTRVCIPILYGQYHIYRRASNCVHKTLTH